MSTLYRFFLNVDLNSQFALFQIFLKLGSRGGGHQISNFSQIPPYLRLINVPPQTFARFFFGPEIILIIANHGLGLHTKCCAGCRTKLNLLFSGATYYSIFSFIALDKFFLIFTAMFIIAVVHTCLPPQPDTSCLPVIPGTKQSLSQGTLVKVDICSMTR